MDIGIGPLGDLPESRTTPSGLTSEVVETATRAEALGFDAAWVGERHFAPETVTASAPFTLLGALAGATESIRLGTSVSVLPLHHPIRLAEQVATLDAVSDGRITLGGGIGYMDAEYDTFGADADRRVGELLDCVEVLKEAAAHEPLDYDGYCHDFEGITVEPRYTQDPRPPIWLGGTVPASMERAATVADGFLGAPTGTETYEAARPVLEEACDDYGAFRTGAMVNVFVADSTEAALETVEPGLLYLARRYARWIGYEAPDEPDTSTGVYGTPAEVIEGLREYVDILGEENTHLLVRLHYPDVPREASDRSLELFADEVLPAL
jgi:alkanesulfonate monooxygenase SsuD/methylene tetrahydromethanopterin reductase-like flavin-dependent oxidoreductase (luciferase family)